MPISINAARPLPRPPAGAPKKIDLGNLAQPGATLRGKTQTVAPGGSVTFLATTNQITGLGTLTVSPPDAATVKQLKVKNMVPGQLGSTYTYRYTVTLNKDTKPGTAVTVHAPGNYQARNDPNWAFDFKVRAG